MIIYIIVGLIYLGILEWYITSGTTEVPPFRIPDRLFHSLLWPVSMVVLLIELVKALRRRRDE
jgi:hypothetical protein